ncbi:MAG: DUF2244 domain-containing protein [Rhizomicrobium sp.]
MSGADPVLLDATLRPNPAMNARTLGAIVGVVAAINLLFALSFVLRGAWPIAPFLGLDVLLLAWAFRESRIAALAFEHVTLTTSRLLVARHPSRGAPSNVALNPYWVRVDYRAEGEDEKVTTAPLLLTSHGKSIQIGAFLGAAQRADFARRLKGALQRARNS